MTILYGYLEVLGFLFIIILLGNVIGEILSKKRPFSDLRREFPRLLRNSAILFSIFLFFIFLYHLLLRP
jgi:hypothetical protein